MIVKPSHPAVKAARALNQRSERLKSGLCIIEGAKMIAEAASSGITIREIYVEVGTECPQIAAQVYEIPRSALITLCDTKTPQSVCAVIELPRALNMAEINGDVIMLDGVSDPGNVGAVLRTARAAGVNCALMSKECADAFSPKALRASMGAAFNVRCAQDVDLAEALTSLTGHAVISTALGGHNLYGRQPINRPFALIIGGEARGISPEILAMSDYVFALPMRGGTESLNAAVAAGIFLYELTMRG